MSPWKNKVGWSRTQKPVLRPFSFFKYTSIFTILQPLGSGYHEIKVNDLPEWGWPWSNGTKAANWAESLKGYLCRCFFFVCLFVFAVIHSTCKHALRKESTIKCSVDDLELSMISAEKVPRSGFRHIDTLFPAAWWSTTALSFRRCDWLFSSYAREVSSGNRSNYKSTRERVECKGLYGRWRLHLIGSWLWVVHDYQFTSKEHKCFKPMIK